jgi:hypothetical protein
MHLSVSGRDGNPVTSGSKAVAGETGPLEGEGDAAAMALVRVEFEAEEGDNSSVLAAGVTGGPGLVQDGFSGG